MFNLSAVSSDAGSMSVDRDTTSGVGSTSMYRGSAGVAGSTPVYRGTTSEVATRERERWISALVGHGRHHS